MRCLARDPLPRCYACGVATSTASIRAALLSEIAVLSELAFRSKAHWGYDARFMEACRAELTIAPDAVRAELVFVLDAPATEPGLTGPIGVYTLEPMSDTIVELGHLFVEPALIGGGYGTLLLDHARRTARDRGFRTLVIQGDPNAAPFYSARGGRLVGTRPSTSIPGRELPIFELTL